MPRLVQRLRIVEFTLDHEAPYVSNMRRRNSRKDSDLNGVVDVRYTGGARMLLALEVGGSPRRPRMRGRGQVRRSTGPHAARACCSRWNSVEPARCRLAAQGAAALAPHGATARRGGSSAPRERVPPPHTNPPGPRNTRAPLSPP